MLELRYLMMGQEDIVYVLMELTINLQWASEWPDLWLRKQEPREVKQQVPSHSFRSGKSRIQTQACLSSKPDTFHAIGPCKRVFNYIITSMLMSIYMADTQPSGFLRFKKNTVYFSNLGRCLRLGLNTFHYISLSHIKAFLKL